MCLVAQSKCWTFQLKLKKWCSKCWRIPSLNFLINRYLIQGTNDCFFFLVINKKWHILLSTGDIVSLDLLRSDGLYLWLLTDYSFDCIICEINIFHFFRNRVGSLPISANQLNRKLIMATLQINVYSRRILLINRREDAFSHQYDDKSLCGK